MDAQTSVAPLTYQPAFPVATYVDDYGEEKIIHAQRGPNGPLRRFKAAETPAALLNRAVAILLGQRIRERRQALGLTAKQVAVRSGSANVNPKQFLRHLETAVRREGVRLGTLYALAHALECEPLDLLPTKQEAMALAGIRATQTTTLAA